MTKKVRHGIQVPGGQFPHLGLGRVSRDLRLAMRLCLPGGHLAVPAVILARQCCLWQAEALDPKLWGQESQEAPGVRVHQGANGGATAKVWAGQSQDHGWGGTEISRRGLGSQSSQWDMGRGKGALPHTGLIHIPRVNCQVLRSIRVSNKPQELPTTVIHRL